MHHALPLVNSAVPVQKRATEKEALAKAVIDREAIEAQLEDNDMQTWLYDPTPLDPEADPVVPHDDPQKTEAMRCTAHALQERLGSQALAKVWLHHAAKFPEQVCSP